MQLLEELTYCNTLLDVVHHARIIPSVLGFDQAGKLQSNFNGRIQKTQHFYLMQHEYAMKFEYCARKTCNGSIQQSPKVVHHSRKLRTMLNIEKFGMTQLNTRGRIAQGNGKSDIKQTDYPAT